MDIVLAILILAVVVYGVAALRRGIRRIVHARAVRRPAPTRRPPSADHSGP